MSGCKFVTMALTIGAVLLSRDSAQAQEKDPHEITSQGVVSEQVREAYTPRDRGVLPGSWKGGEGPALLDCLKRQVQTEEDAIAAVYSARMSYLEVSPELAASLYKSQMAWLQFRMRTAGTSERSHEPAKPQKSFQNCLLRPQSSSASRLTAGASGFLNLSQSGERPDR